MQENNLEVWEFKKTTSEPQKPIPYSRILFGSISVIIFSLKNLLDGSELQFIRVKGRRDFGILCWFLRDLSINK